MRAFALAGLVAMAFTGTALATGNGNRANTASLQPLSLEDVLGLESFGSAAFSPEGSYFVYERNGAKTAHPGSPYGTHALNQSVYVVKSSSGEQTLVRGSDPGVVYSLSRWGAPFSPDGRFLALSAVTADKAGFALWDTASQTVRVLPGEMASWSYANAWTRDGRYLYVAAASGKGMASYPEFARRLTERWNEVWKGSSAQVVVMSSNPVVPQDEAPVRRLMMARASDGETVEVARGNYRRIVASPDGLHFAAVRIGPQVATETFDTGPGELQVYALTAQGARLEASFPEIDTAWQRLSWSPDGRKLAVGGFPRGASSDNARLYVYDIQARALTDAGLGDVALNQYDTNTGFSIAEMGWMDSTPVVIGSPPVPGRPPWAEREQSATDYGKSSRSDLWAVTSHGPRKLTAFARSSTSAFADPEGYGGLFVVADGALWKLQLNQAPERVTPEDGPMVLGFATSSIYPPTSREAFAPIAGGRPSVQLLAKNGDVSQRMTFDLETRKFEPARKARMLADTADHRQALLVEQNNHAQEMTLWDGSVSKRIASINEQLNSRAEGEVVALDYQLAGRAVRSWVVLPPSRKPGVAVPAVLWVYGGFVWSQTSEKPLGTRLEDIVVVSGQLAAANGYAMILPSLPMREGAEADVPALLADGAIAAIDAAAAKGLVDPKRVVVAGHSFGGYSAAAILARRSDRFRAGIAISGVYDFISAYGSNDLKQSLSGEPIFWRSSMDYIERSQIGLREPPWRAPQAYIKNSVLFSVDRIDAPLMIMQGDLDFDVTSAAGAERIYAALVRAGKQPVFVRYFGEGHWPESLPNKRDQWARILSWFDYYLGVRR